ncbi:hypothetical protein AOLI_G00119040 [Acnodon oligacanthus]
MVQDQLMKLMSPKNHPAGRPRYKPRSRPRQRTSSSGRADTLTVKNQGLSVLQLNVEGLTIAKLEVIRHLANSNKVAVALQQETHWVSDDNLMLSGFLLAGSIHSKKHKMATFVQEGLSWSATSQSPPGCNIEWLVTKIQEISVVNTYKPPLTALTIASLPPVPAPAIYVGDFNCQHTDWDYNHTSYDGVALIILRAAKHNILLGYSKNYIPGWDEKCSCLLHQHQQASSREEMEATATTLLQKLDDT